MAGGRCTFLLWEKTNKKHTTPLNLIALPKAHMSYAEEPNARVAPLYSPYINQEIRYLSLISPT